MNFLKKRSTAIIITCIVVVAFSVIGMCKSASRLASDIEAEFYADKGIEYQLQNKITAATGLVSILCNYEETASLCEDMRSAYNELYDAKTISEKFAANEHLEASYASIKGILDSGACNMTERDADAVSSYENIMDGAQRIISNDGYNDLVSDYESSVISAFPLSLIRGILSGYTPDYFA